MQGHQGDSTHPIQVIFGTKKKSEGFATVPDRYVVLVSNELALFRDCTLKGPCSRTPDRQGPKGKQNVEHKSRAV